MAAITPTEALTPPVEAIDQVEGAINVQLQDQYVVGGAVRIDLTGQSDKVIQQVIIDYEATVPPWIIDTTASPILVFSAV
jgi:hypothetical protein